MKKCHVQRQISKKMCACVGKFDSLWLDCQNHIYYMIQSQLHGYQIIIN